MLTIDLNCDMGESTELWLYSIEKDLSLLTYISSMNLACGFHAGDPHTMHQLVDAALAAGVAIGAHPGFPDRDNFGRTNKQYSPEEIYDMVVYQLGATAAFLHLRGARLHHVKPHGALYNMAAADNTLAMSIATAVYDYDKQLQLYGLAGSELIHAAKAVGLTTRNEVFADRTYQSDGSLTPRSQPGALINDPQQAIEQVVQMIEKNTISTVGGYSLTVVPETICLHGDGASALPFAKTIVAALTQKGIAIQHA